MDEIFDVAKSAGVWKAIGKFVDGKVEAGKIIRIAKAEVERDDIKARARQRGEMDELRHQANIESVLSKTKGQFNKDTKPDAVEDDWLANYFDKIRNVSDADMQMLWSRILAGEMNSANSFSKKTVNLFADLDKRDAEMFVRLCRFRCEMPPIEEELFIFPYIPKDYRKHREYDCIKNDLENLEEKGLIVNADPLGNPNFKWLQKSVEVRSAYADIPFLCCGKKLLIRLTQGEHIIPYGIVKFTSSGLELSYMIKCEPADGFLEFLRRHYPLSFLPE